MNKVYAMLAILTLGAPLTAAELTAPQLPFIDAAMVRAQPQEKETINISSAFPGMQACKFTALNGRACVFTCKDGSTVNRPALVSSLVPNGCAKVLMVPAQGNKTAPETRTSAADAASAREIAAIAKSPASPFGAIDGGNLGLSAYRLTPEAANMTVRLVRQAFPGINLGNRKYAAAGPQLILVVTSEDEASVYMYEQSPSSGRLSRLEDFNSADAADAFYCDTQLAAFASGYDRSDWAGVLQGLAGKGRGIALPLGAGSARPYWWSK